MINKLNKILFEQFGELKEGITKKVMFLSNKDLRKIVNLDKTLLIDTFIDPSVDIVIYFKEEIFVNALITYKNETLYVHIEGVYIPMDLTHKRFNTIMNGLCGRSPNRFYKVNQKGDYYLYCWWEKIW